MPGCPAVLSTPALLGSVGWGGVAAVISDTPVANTGDSGGATGSRGMGASEAPTMGGVSTGIWTEGAGVISISEAEACEASTTSTTVDSRTGSTAAGSETTTSRTFVPTDSEITTSGTLAPSGSETATSEIVISETLAPTSRIKPPGASSRAFQSGGNSSGGGGVSPTGSPREEVAAAPSGLLSLDVCAPFLEIVPALFEGAAGFSSSGSGASTATRRGSSARPAPTWTR